MAGQKSFSIPDQNIAKLEGEIESLNRKARKLDQPEIVAAVTGWRYDKKECSAHRITCLIWTVEIVGSAPRINGWTLVGKLHQPQGTTTHLVTPAPGQMVPELYRTCEWRQCDHCHTNRNRKATYILRHECGQYKRVGRSCLQDFLGHSSPEGLASYAELLWAAEDAAGEAGDWEGLGGGYCQTWSLEDVLALTVMYCRESGWISRTRAKEESNELHLITATADYVLSNLTDTKSDKERANAEDRATAKKIIAWLPGFFAEKGRNATSDYIYNLQVATSSGVVSYETIGLACSAVACYNRHLVELAEREEKARSQHVGTVGQRIETDVEFIGQNFIDGVYGTTHLLVLRDESGNILKWFSSRCQDVEIGEHLKIKGTIKKHDQYRGVHETVLTRCKILDAS